MERRRCSPCKLSEQQCRHAARGSGSRPRNPPWDGMEQVERVLVEVENMGSESASVVAAVLELEAEVVGCLIHS